MIAEAAEYQQSLRGPRHRWWRPLLSLLLVVVFGLIGTLLVTVFLVVAGWLTGSNGVFAGGDTIIGVDHPLGFLALNVGLALLIPAVLGALWLAHGTPPGQVASVVGTFRWRWFARCLGVLFPLWLLLVGISLVVDGVPGHRPTHWQALAVIMLLTTPLQAAGEEVAFRGWALLSLGSWFADRRMALVVPLVFSSVLFAAAHGSTDPWVVAQLLVFAVATGVLTWRTGGLEAAIAVHVVNNVTVIGTSLLLGGFEQGFIDDGATSTSASFGGALVVHVIAVVLLWKQADRVGTVRLTPAAVPA